MDKVNCTTPSHMISFMIFADILKSINMKILCIYVYRSNYNINTYFKMQFINMYIFISNL